MRHGPLALLALLASAGLAAGQGAPNFDRTEAIAPPLLEVGDNSLPFTVRYCYNTGGAVPASITVGIDGPPWLTASAEPSSFQGTANGSCGSRAVTLQLRVAREAPAFTPETVTVHLRGQGASGSTAKDVPFVAQVNYAAVLTIEPPARVQIARGDQGSLSLRVGVAANDGTRLDVTASDPAGKITAFIPNVSTNAGRGLDAVDPVTIPLTITVSPGAEPGVHRLPVTIATAYARSPSNVGERETVNVEVEVVGGGGPTPAPGAALLLGFVAVAALAARSVRSKTK